MKKERLNAVKRIIAAKAVGTQEELIALLRDEGFSVTQATASRDIGELGLVKLNDADGKTRYAFPEKGSVSGSARRYTTILREAVVSVAPAGNIIVVKCHSGMGNAACESIDSIVTNHVVGTIAGDNTIFLAAETPETALEIMDTIRGIINR